MRAWRGEYGPFIRYAQFKYCRRLIVVPLSTFHRLAELIGDPSGQLIFLFNTTRCGSTLLSQVDQLWSAADLIVSKHYTVVVLGAECSSGWRLSGDTA